MRRVGRRPDVPRQRFRGLIERSHELRGRKHVCGRRLWRGLASVHLPFDPVIFWLYIRICSEDSRVAYVRYAWATLSPGQGWRRSAQTHRAVAIARGCAVVGSQLQLTVVVAQQPVALGAVRRITCCEPRAVHASWNTDYARTSTQRVPHLVKIKSNQMLVRDDDRVVLQSPRGLARSQRQQPQSRRPRRPPPPA